MGSAWARFCWQECRCRYVPTSTVRRLSYWWTQLSGEQDKYGFLVRRLAILTGRMDRALEIESTIQERAEKLRDCVGAEVNPRMEERYEEIRVSLVSSEH